MEEKKHCYEGMFLLDANTGTFEAATESLQKILARSEVEVLALKSWDERKLAYEIQDRQRGLYVLTYLKIAPAKVVEVEHDCQLSENILRILLIRKDSISDEELGADTPAELAQIQAAEAEAAEAVRLAEAEAAEAVRLAEAEAKAATAAEAAETDDAPVEEVTEALEDAAAVVHADSAEEPALESDEKPADE